MAAHDDAGPSPDGPNHRAGRRWRWALFVMLLALVVLSAGYFTWSKQAERDLDAYVARLRSEDEPVEPGQLVHPPIPLEDDAAPDLRDAAAAADFKGEAYLTYEQIDFDNGVTADDKAVIAKLVENSRDALEKIHAARGKGDADWRVPYQSPALMTLLPHLNDQRGLATLAQAAARHEWMRGDDGAALEYLRDMLAVGEASDAQPVMVGHLVAIAVRAMASGDLMKLAPGLSVRGGAGANPGHAPGAATAEQVRGAIRELLDEARSDAGLRQAFRGERVLQLDTGRLMADRKLDTNTLIGSTPGGLAGLGAPPLPRAMILGDTLIIIRYATDMLAAVEKSPDYPAFARNNPGLPAPIRANPKFHILAGILMPAYDRFVTQHYRGKADRRLAAAALALRLYAADHDGRYPAALDELVPAYLPAVPKDPFAAGGKPLSYKSATESAAPRVYSVGENGTDDGGSAAPLNPQRPRPGHWEASDAVVEMKPAPLVKPAPPPEKAKADDRP